MYPDSVFRGVEVERAVFIHTSFPFPWFMVFFPHSLFILCEGWPEERGRLERSLDFLPPGESVEFASRDSRVWHSLARCLNPSHSILMQLWSARLCFLRSLAFGCCVVSYCAGFAYDWPRASHQLSRVARNYRDAFG